MGRAANLVAAVYDYRTFAALIDVFSAKDAGSCKPAAAGKSCSPKRALKARIKAAFASVPNIAFVRGESRCLRW